MALDLNRFAGAPVGSADIDYNNLPEQGGGFGPLLQPGRYLFGLPSADQLTDANFDEVDPKPGATWTGKRLKVMFDKNAPLVVRQAINKDDVGTPYTTTITNIEMKRGKKDDPNAPMVSDLDYVNAALKVTPRPKTNGDYAKAIVAAAQAGGQFYAQQEWRWTCGVDRDARFPDGQGGFGTIPLEGGTNQKGCGKKYYEKDVAKIDGKYPEHVACECGADIRAFGNLRRFEPAS